MTEINWWGGGQLSLENNEPDEIKKVDIEDVEETPEEEGGKAIPDINYFGGEF